MILTNAISDELYAHWAPDLTDYLFLETRYKGPKPRHFCNSGSLALTDDASFDDVMTVSFCPKSFNKKCDPAQGKCFDTSDLSSSKRKAGDTIVNRQPRSLTMLYEFVHVARGHSEFPRYGG